MAESLRLYHCSSRWIRSMALADTVFGNTCVSSVAVGLDQLNQGLPVVHGLHLGQEPLPFGALLDGAPLIIDETELLATHGARPAMRSSYHLRVDRFGDPDLP